MAITKVNVGIWTAVVTTVGGIITAWIMHQPPPPAPTSSVAAAVGHVHVSNSGVSAYVYDSPVEDPAMGRIGELTNGMAVQIVCTEPGPAQTGSNGTSSLWDKIQYKQGYGYLNDAEVDTNSDLAVAPTCNA